MGSGVLVARDDPLGHLPRHPPGVTARRTAGGERVRRGQLRTSSRRTCAPRRRSSPLTEDDFGLFDGEAAGVVASLEEAGYLRRRSRGWFWTRRDRAVDLADIRSSGGQPGSDRRGRDWAVSSAPSTRRPPTRRCIRAPSTCTWVRPISSSTIDRPTRGRRGRSCPTRLLDVRPLGHRHPHRRRQTSTSAVGRADAQLRHRRGVDPGRRLPQAPRRHRRSAGRGAADAARPPPDDQGGLVDPGRVGRRGPLESRPATCPAPRTPPSTPRSASCRCSRPATAGTSVACRPPLHEDTGQLTVFVYDGHPGGAGFAERGFDVADSWLSATREAIASCQCDDGLSVVRPVPQVRQRQQPARQAWRDSPPRRAAH